MPDPGPNQNEVNRQQGRVNDLQGDVNDALGEALNNAYGNRQDKIDADMAETKVRRDDQFDAQAITNTAQDVTNAAQNLTNTAQDETNVAQEVINSAAVQALGEVAKATAKVAELLRLNVVRGKRWTAVLGVVIAIVIVLSVVGYTKLRQTAKEQNKANISRCQVRNEQLQKTKEEFVKLIETASAGSSTAAGRARGEAFLKSYRVGLDERLKPTSCGGN